MEAETLRLLKAMLKAVMDELFYDLDNYAAKDRMERGKRYGETIEHYWLWFKCVYGKFLYLP